MDSGVTCSACHTLNNLEANYCSSCGTVLKQSLVTPDMTCPFCLKPILETYIVCPNCGKTLRQKPLPSNFIKQLGIYTVSLLLPPLGLWPGLKYLFQKDAKLRWIGIIAITLTIISLFLTIYFTIQIAQQVNIEMDKQLQLMQF